MPEKRGWPQVIVQTTGRGMQMQMFTTTGKHSYVLDEPEVRGGDDLGATPFEFFAAGYGG